MSQSSTHLTETLEVAYAHRVGQVCNLSKPLCLAVNEDNWLHSIRFFWGYRRWSYMAWCTQNMVIQADGCPGAYQSLLSIISVQLGEEWSSLTWPEEKAQSRSTSGWPLPSSLYLSPPCPSSHSRPIQVSRGSSSRPCLLSSQLLSQHLPFQSASIPFSTLPTVLYHSSYAFPQSSLCSHRHDHLRGAHLPAMSRAPSTEGHTGSEQTELPVRECKARALCEGWACTRVQHGLEDYRWNAFKMNIKTAYSKEKGKYWGIRWGKFRLLCLGVPEGQNEVRQLWPIPLFRVHRGSTATADSLWACFYTLIHSKLYWGSSHKYVKFLKGRKHGWLEGKKRKSNSQIKLKVTQVFINKSFTFWHFSSECPSCLVIFAAPKLRSFTW